MVYSVRSTFIQINPLNLGIAKEGVENIPIIQSAYDPFPVESLLNSKFALTDHYSNSSDTAAFSASIFKCYNKKVKSCNYFFPAWLQC